jgi:hypothetical protein
MLEDSSSNPVENEKSKRDIVEQVADMTLHQLSIALSQKKSRKSEARCVALLGFYSLSMNNMGSKSSVLLLSPKLSKKGKGRASIGTICFLLSIASTKYINGNKNGNQGMNRSALCHPQLYFTYLSIRRTILINISVFLTSSINATVLFCSVVAQIIRNIVL